MRPLILTDLYRTARLTALLAGTSLLLLLAACGTGSKNDGKITLAFDPGTMKNVKMNYEFTVNSVSTGNRTHFMMDISGNAEVNDKKEVIMHTHNDKIMMDGNIQGKDIRIEAGTTDSVPADVGMVITPVFTMLNKDFFSVYDTRLNKISEMMQNASGGMDSVENKMQFYIRYPDSAVKIGDSWKRELVIKSGNKMNCSATYTLKEIKDGTATITMTGKLSGKGESFGHEFDIDGKLDGTVQVDVKTGWPLSTTIDQEFVLNLAGQKIQMQYAIKHSIAPF
jgi:hypothetical protein